MRVCGVATLAVAATAIVVSIDGARVRGGEESLRVSANSEDWQVVVLGSSYCDWGNVYQYTHGAWPTKDLYPQGAFTDKQSWTSLVYKGSVLNYALGSATTDVSKVPANTGPNSEFPVSGGVQQLAMYNQAKTKSDRFNLAFVVFSDLMLNELYFDWVSGKDITSEQVMKEIANTYVELTRAVAETASALSSKSERVAKVIVSLPIDVMATPFGKAYLKGAESWSETVIKHVQNGLAGLSKNTTLFNKRCQLVVDSFSKEIIDAPFRSKAENETVVHSDATDQTFTIPLLNLTEPCISTSGHICQDPSSYMFYDTFHPTSVVHELWAEYMTALIKNN